MADSMSSGTQNAQNFGAVIVRVDLEQLCLPNVESCRWVFVPHGANNGKPRSSLREFVQLPSSWPPAREEGGVRAAVHYVILPGSAGSGGLAAVP